LTRVAAPVASGPLVRRSFPGAGLAAAGISALLIVGMAFSSSGLELIASMLALAAALVSPPTGLLIAGLTACLDGPEAVPPPGFAALLVGAIVNGSIYRLPIDRPKLRIGPVLAIMGAFVVYVGVQQLPELLSGYAGEGGHLVGYQLEQLLTTFGLILAAALVLPGRDPRPFLAAIIASAVMAALLAIVTHDVAVVGPPLAGLLGSADPGVRAVGSFANPNYFGVVEAMTVAAAIAWAVAATDTRQRVALVGVALVGTIAVVLTLSRGALVTLFAGLAVLAFVRYRLAGAAVTLLLLVALVVLYPTLVNLRLGGEAAAASTFQALAESDDERLAAVLAGPRIWATAPLFGIGFGHYSLVSAQFSGNLFATAAHNWYINVLAEQGLVGIVLWLALLVAIAAVIRRRPLAQRTVAFAVLASFAAACMFLEPPTSYQTAALPVIVLTATLVGRWDTGSQQPPDGP
jgi:O-antigen ligase